MLIPKVFIFTRSEYIISRQLFADEIKGKTFFRNLHNEQCAYSLSSNSNGLFLDDYRPEETIHFLWDGDITGGYTFRASRRIKRLLNDQIEKCKRDGGIYILVHEQPLDPLLDYLKKFDFGLPESRQYKTKMFKGLHSRGNKYYGKIISLIENHIDLSDISYEELVREIINKFDFDFEKEAAASFE